MTSQGIFSFCAVGLVQREMAADDLAGRAKPGFGALDPAAVLGVGAAGVELAAGRPLEQARHLAAERRRRPAPVGVGHRRRGEQRLGVRVRRPLEDGAGRALLDERPMYMIASRSLAWRTTGRLWVITM